MLEHTIVVGEDKAPFGGNTEHRPGLVKGELVGSAGAPSLARQLEGGHMMCVHPVIRQAEQKPLGFPDLLARTLIVSFQATPLMLPASV